MGNLVLIYEGNSLQLSKKDTEVRLQHNAPEVRFIIPSRASRPLNSRYACIALNKYCPSKAVSCEKAAHDRSPPFFFHVCNDAADD
jgi:hypothetical protein